MYDRELQTAEAAYLSSLRCMQHSGETPHALVPLIVLIRKLPDGCWTVHDVHKLWECQVRPWLQHKPTTTPERLRDAFDVQFFAAVATSCGGTYQGSHILHKKRWA